ncbi:SpoIIE family protein phosphatase [bacterium]|nr:SpoIIE family protein phosphatase [bacterium]
MKKILTFYRAVDPMKGSWDGYGYFPAGQDDFLAFVTDAPSGASIHTPEVIKEFWQNFTVTNNQPDLPQVELADALNRLQNELQLKGRRENILYQATIAVARKIGSQLYYCCIGDSVLQVYRNAKLYRLSESEVWDGALIAGEADISTTRQKTREIRFIGSNGSFIQTSEICALELKEQDLLLLYTDGVEDLLPPDRLLQIIGSSAEEMRSRLETAFAQDKLKDDATVLAVPVRIQKPLQAEKEFASLRLQLDRIQKDQKEIHNQLMDSAASRARLDKIEASLQKISQDLQRFSKRPEPGRASTAAGSGVSAKRKRVLPWLIAVFSLLLGTAAGSFLFKDHMKPAETRLQQPAKIKRVVAPPEIPSAADCEYVIQKGDSLDKIALSRSITMEQILQWNPLQKKNEPLQIGKTLTVCKEIP